MNGYNTSIALKVDWADLDLFGHVNNVAFFRYIQTARVNYCDKAGLSSLNETELSFMVASTSCQFKQPLKYPCEIIVSTRLDWMKNSSFQLTHIITDNNNTTYAEGTDILVVFNHSKKLKTSISTALHRRFVEIENRELPKKA